MFTHVLRGCLYLVVLLALPPIGSAFALDCELYVNASDGDDSNSGSATRPFRSVEHAWQRAMDGDRICVAAGEYVSTTETDGIALISGGKSATFILTPFGSESAVLFTEKEFRVAIGSGTVRFEALDGVTLLLGAGRLNAHSSFPGNVNFLHSLVVESGTLDFGSVNTTLEQSVGNPGFQNPDAPDQSAPDSAAVVVGGHLRGDSLFWEQAPRSVRIQGGESGATRSIPLPDLPPGSLLLLAQQDHFLPVVPFESAGQLRVTSSGDVTLENLVRLGGTQPVEHAGNGRLSFNPSMASGTRLRVDVTGPGTLSLSNPAFEAGAALTISAGSRSLLILQDGLHMHGAVISEGRVDITGQARIDLREAGDGVRMLRGATLTGSTRPPGLVINAGPGLSPRVVFSGAVEGGTLTTQGKMRFSATETIDVLDVDSGELDVEGALSLGSLIMNGGVVRAALSVTVAGMLTMTGSELSASSATVSASEALLEASTIQADVLRIAEQLTATGGDLTSVTVEFVAGTAPARLQSSTPLGGLSIIGSHVLISSADTFNVSGWCDVRNSARLEVPAGHLLSCGRIMVQGGSTLQLGSGAQVRSLSEVILASGRLSLLGEDHHVEATTDVTFPDTGGEYTSLRLHLQGSFHALSTAAPTVLHSVDWSPGPTQISFSGAWHFLGSMDFSNTSVLLNANSVLRFSRDVDMSGVGLAFPPSASFVFDGDTRLNLSVVAPELPGIIMSGTRLDITGNVFFRGNVTIQSGVVDILGHELTVTENLVIQGGRLESGSGSSIRIDRDLLVTTGTMVMDSSSLLSAGGSVAFLRTAPPIARMLLHGSGMLRIPAGARLRTLMVEGSYDVPQSEAFLVTDTLRVSGLLVLTADLKLSGSLLDVPGTLTGGGDIMLENAATVIRGPGLVSNLTVTLPGVSDTVMLASASLRIGTRLKLRTGGIQVDGGSLLFGTESAPLGVFLTMNGEQARGNITARNGGVINPESHAIDLTFDGAVAGFPTLTDVSPPGPIRNLDIQTIDILNSPPVFGLAAGGQNRIQGQFNLSEGARFVADSLVLSLPDATHRIAGQMNAGSILVANARSIILGSGTGVLGNVLIQGETAELRAFQSLQSLSAISAEIRLTGSTSLFLADSLSLSQSTLYLDQAMEVGESSEVARIQLDESRVIMGDVSDVTVRSNFNIVLSRNSQWVVESQDADRGFLRIAGNGAIRAPDGIARLHIEQGAGDIFIEDDLAVTGKFLMQGGTLRLSGHALLLRGQDWTYEGGRILGIPGDTTNRVIVSGPFHIALLSSLRLEHVSVDFLPAPTDAISLSGPSRSLTTFTVQNQEMTVTEGTLSLGRTDIILQGTTPDVLLLDNAVIESQVEVENILFPFDDTAVGEIVMDSPVAQSGVRVMANSRISALRLKQSSRLSSAGTEFLVTGRLVLGDNGAQLNTDVDDRLILESGLTIVRRGTGSFSHAPVLKGPIHLAYDLDDGSVVGSNRQFGAQTLLTGLEMPSRVLSLSILAGNQNAQQQTVRLVRDVRVDQSLTVWSGTFSTGSARLTLSGGAVVALSEIDPQAPPVLSGLHPWAADGPVDISLTNAFSSLPLTDAILPPSAPIRSMSVSMGSDELGTGPDIILTGDRSVGSLFVSANDPGSSFNLDGSDFTVRDSVVMESGTIASNGSALLTVNGPVRVQANAEIGGNVRLRSLRELELRGRLNNLSTEVAGRADIHGAWSRQTQAVLFGDSTLVTFSSPELALADLVLRGTPSRPSRFTVRGPSNDSVVRISSALRAEHGVLRVENALLVIPVSANLSTSSAGWIQSGLTRPVPAGFTGSVFMGIGGEHIYKPLTIRFTSPVLSQTGITTRVSDREPLLESGLPYGDISDTGVFSWHITSSVNFAGSQDFAVDVPSESGDESTRGILTRSAAGSFSRWAFSGTPLTDGWTAPGLRQGLDRSGLVVTTAEPERNGPRAYIHVLDTWIRAPGTQLHVDIEGEVIGVTGGPNSTTGIIPVSEFPSSGLNVDILSVSGLDNQELIARTTLSATDNRVTVVSLATDATVHVSPPLDRDSQWVVFNASPANPAVSVLQLWPERQVLVESVAPLLIGASSPGVTFADPFTVQGAGLPDVSIDLSTALPLDFPSVLVIREGLSTIIMSPDGTTISPGIVTHTDEPLEAGLQFKIGDYYPNPVRGAATIPLDVPSAADVRVTIVDMLGREVRRAEAGRFAAGRGQLVRVDAAGLAAGTYLVVVEAAAAGRTWRETGTMTVFR